jgi:hypothetical protein
MPLGKISKSQIKDAYKELAILLLNLQGDKHLDHGSIVEACNAFYNIIPHSTIEFLDSEKKIKVLL